MVLRPQLPELVGAAAPIPLTEETRCHFESSAQNAHQVKTGAEGFNHVTAGGTLGGQDQGQLLPAKHLLPPPLMNEDMCIQLSTAPQMRFIRN
jgi:hypothetical protein